MNNEEIQNRLSDIRVRARLANAWLDVALDDVLQANPEFAEIVPDYKDFLRKKLGIEG